MKEIKYEVYLSNMNYHDIVLTVILSSLCYRYPLPLYLSCSYIDHSLGEFW